VVLEVGLAHGYFLMGPFTLELGPLRDSNVRYLQVSYNNWFIIILTLALTIYGVASLSEKSVIK
jgi:hypothetical protein